VLDEWVERIIQPYCKGKVKLFRYADDAIICCEFETDAMRIRETLPKRLAKYKLVLNEEKTKMVDFFKRKSNAKHPSRCFRFPRITFYWGKTKKGKIIPKLKTSGKTMRNKLAKVEAWIKDIRCKNKLKEIGERSVRS